MRITGGTHKGRKLTAFGWKGTKPSTDKVRQALFNIIRPELDTFNCILDCYAGTGLISLEFISRGVGEVTSLDKNHKCCVYMQSNKELLGIENWEIVKVDVLSFIKEGNETFDLIFADPPYDDKEIENFVDLILEGDILTKNGIFVLEHSSRRQFDHLRNYQTKVYGETALSFYK